MDKNNMLCSRCKKRLAVIYMTRMENGQTVSEGLCLPCAKELGLKPVDDLMNKMGLSEEDLDKMSDQMMEVMGDMEDGEDGFEKGGAMPFPFMQNLFGGLMNREKENAEGEGNPPPQKEKPEKGAPKYKYLENYCENLTRKAREGKMDAIIGREKEIYRVVQILNRRTKNNPCLIGEPGVGKTAIAEGIAQRIVEGKVPAKIAQKEVYMLDLTGLVAGTQFRGQFESRVKGLVEDVKKHGNVILFIDEVHTLVGVGDSEGSMNAANILKPALSRGEIQVIGATTFNEYRKNIEKDAALERRFQAVKVGEPTIEDTIAVLRGIKKYYEDYHRVKVSDFMVERAVVLSERYILDRFLPDKAIDLLDEACSTASLECAAQTEYDKLAAEREEKQRALSDVINPEEGAEIDYQRMAELKSEIARLEERMDALHDAAFNSPVTEDHLAKVIELWSGIPASKVKESELQKVADLETGLKKRIIGQDEAVNAVAAAVRRSRIRLSAKKRPASFIFVGPTGVGKTELVKVLSEELFDNVEPLIRLDMSEFMEKHSVSRIIGSPPGYVGYDEAGQLTEKVRRRPYSIVLFDEIEKAHPDVMNILLQILDEGRITDAQGRQVSFENTIIIMTSNAGSERQGSALGFDKTRYDDAKDKAETSLRQFLRPEFLARVDEVVVFRPLTEEDMQKIAALMLEELKKGLAEREIKFGWDDGVLRLAATEAYGHKSGARDLRNVLRRRVEDPICTLLAGCPEQPPAMAIGEGGTLYTACGDSREAAGVTVTAYDATLAAVGTKAVAERVLSLHTEKNRVLILTENTLLLGDAALTEVSDREESGIQQMAPWQNGYYCVTEEGLTHRRL